MRHPVEVFRRRIKAGPGEPQAPLLQPLNRGEVEWRDGQIGLAVLLAQRYTGASEDPLPSLDRLDATVAGWLVDDDRDDSDGDDDDDDGDGDGRLDVNALVNAIGMAFGTHLATDARLTWVIATDRHGSDVALHGEPGNVLLYPANAVAKRVIAAETPFMVALHAALVSSVDQVRARVQGT